MTPISSASYNLIDLVLVVLSDVAEVRLSGKEINEADLIECSFSKYRSVVDLTSCPQSIIDDVESIVIKVVKIIHALEERLVGAVEVGKVQIIQSIQQLRHACKGNLNNSRLIKSAVYKLVLDRLSPLEK